ncbi:unnamed protein product [Closterium sp. Yama58-4]|nr:unnamed protein product [Closterium sp. Yama58-4]
MQSVEHFHEKLILPDEEFALLEAAVAAAEREASARQAARAGSSATIVVGEHPRVDRKAEVVGRAPHAQNDAPRRGGRSGSAGSSAEEASRRQLSLETTQKSLCGWMRPETLFEAPRISESPFQAPQMAEPVTRRPLFPDIEDVGSRNALPAEWTRGVPGGADGCVGEREAGMEAWGMSTEEWCEQRVVFSLARGAPPPTAAMRAGAERHAALEREVVEAVEVAVQTREDAWALRLLGAAARVLALGEGVRDAMGEVIAPLTLSHPLSPRHRLQLMCYSALLTTMVQHRLPQERFFSFFACTPTPLSPIPCSPLQAAADVLQRAAHHHGAARHAAGAILLLLPPPTPHRPLSASSRACCRGFPVEKASLCWCVLILLCCMFQITCLADVTAAVSHAFQSLQPLHSTLLLRYEWQADGSLIHEDRFPYDPHWLQASISTSLEFWLRRRRPFTVPREEAWKCSWCSFAPVCRPGLRWKGQAGQGSMSQT